MAPVPLPQAADISTHTLARRVTTSTLACIQATVISTHTLARRVTAAVGSRRADRIYFNPHPRTEGDHKDTKKPLTFCHFNPHPRTEGDLLIAPVLPLGVISTHTLARRVTVATVHVSNYGAISTHTLARRVTT